VTVEEMEDLLDRLGMEVVSTRGDEVQSYCPAHVQRTGHEDHNPSFWINSDTGAFICFSCQFKGGVSTLISTVQNIDFEEASTWLTSSTGGLLQKLDRAFTKKEVFQEVTNLTEANLAAFKPPTDHMLKGRGITAESAEKFGLLYDERKDCWIIPIREPLTNALWGWQEKGVTGRYFKNYPTGVQKSLALFGYHQYGGGDTLVVESPLDVARMASVGVFGGVSTYGAMVSKAQINLIRGADRIIFAMDNDEAGRKSSLELLETSKKLGFECWFFNYDHTDMKDVGGMSKDEILSGIKNARHSLQGSRAI